MTDVLQVDTNHPDPAVIARAAACLRGGGLVAFPTETVYGLGVHALDAAAVGRLFQAKQRPAHDPLIVHVLSLADAAPLAAEVPAAAETLARRFWPGPLTMVLRRASLVPDAVTAGLDTVALRAPSHPVARALIGAAGVPIAAPSANLFSRPSPTRAQHVLDDLRGRIDLVLDAGPAIVGVESTVLDLSGSVPTILRPGAVTAAMLRAVLPRVDFPAAAEGPMRSPGMLSKHYAPRAPLTLFEGTDAAAVRHRLVAAAREALDAGRAVGLLLAREDVAAVQDVLRSGSGALHVRVVGSERDPDAVAAVLYEALRELDNTGVDTILARGFPGGTGLEVAVQDRLRRAAAGRIVHV